MKRSQLSDTEKQMAVETLGAAVAAFLPDWTVKPRGVEFEKSVQHEVDLVRAGGLEITLNMFRYGLDPAKVCVFASKWPTFTEWDLQGTANTFEANSSGTKDGYIRDNRHSISANDLRDPRESVDSITVTVERGAEAVAKEITRRLIPIYEKAYARCVTVAQSRQAYQDKTKAAWLEVCGITGGKIWRGQHYGVAGVLDVECRHSETVRITADVTPAKLKQIIEALESQKVTA